MTGSVTPFWGKSRIPQPTTHELPVLDKAKFPASVVYQTSRSPQWQPYATGLHSGLKLSNSTYLLAIKVFSSDCNDNFEFFIFTPSLHCWMCCTVFGLQYWKNFPICLSVDMKIVWGLSISRTKSEIFILKILLNDTVEQEMLQREIARLQTLYHLQLLQHQQQHEQEHSRPRRNRSQDLDTEFANLSINK